MKALDKLRIIAKAKFSNKSNLGDWYNSRLDICDQCPINSKNIKKLSAKEIAMVTFNGGKPTCTACGCEVAAKTSVRGEECGLTKRNQTPLWGKLPVIEIGSFDDFYIENLSSDIVTMTIEDKISLDYGDIKKGAKATFQLSVRDKKNLVTKLEVLSSCGCTVPSISKKGETYFVSVKYDSLRVGKINKNITFRLVREGLTYNFKANIVGNVKN